MSENKGSVLLVGGDLMARSRVEGAAAAAGLEVTSAPRLPEPLGHHALVVLDLDGGGPDLVEQWAQRGDQTRAVGFVSHVDASLMEAARDAGIEALPRGRFWRSLPELLGDL